MAERPPVTGEHEDPRFRPARRRFLGLAALLTGGTALAATRPWLDPVARTADTPGSRPRRNRRLESSRPALGTWMRVVVHDPDPARAERAVEAAFQAVRRVDMQMSIHRHDSQLSRVNAAAGRGSVRVDAAVLDVVERACAIARRTDGLYDPTILTLMRLFGFYEGRRKSWPGDREIAAALDRTGWRHVRVDRARGRLGLDREGVAVDLGSAGKGWALDRAVDAIRDAGVASALVDLGGNVYGLGSPDDDSEGWAVGVPHPVTGRMERVITLRDRAVATSNDREQFHSLAHRRVGHLLDARRGRPANGHPSATVLARTGLESDVHSTAAYLLGPGGFRGFPEALETWFLG